MNNNPLNKSTGTVENIVAKGAGLASGEIGVSLVTGPNQHSSYWAFMDTPRHEFFKIIKIAFEAMWDSKQVEITWTEKEGGDNIIKDIRQV